MRLIHALQHIAPFALDAERGADGLIVVSSAHGGIVYARQAGAVLVCRAEVGPIGLALLDAESVKKATSTLKIMQHPSVVEASDDRLVLEERVEGGEDEGPDAERRVNRATFLRIDPRRLPTRLQQIVHTPLVIPVPQPFVEVAADLWEATQRVATCAAGEKDDRSGLTNIQLGPQFADATNEVLVARTPLILPGVLRVPAALLEYLPAHAATIGIGDTPHGIVIASSGQLDEAPVILIVDDPRSRAGHFPDLGPTWERFWWGRPGVKVAKVDLRKAVSAAKQAAAKTQTGYVVRLDVQARSIAARGGENETWVATIPPEERAKDAPPPPVPSTGTGLFASAALLTAIGSLDGDIEVIVHPGFSPPVLELRSGDQRVLVAGMAELAQPFAPSAAPGQR